jgi:hypothetical protein
MFENTNCDDKTCKRTVIQKADVSIPIEIKPKAVVGKITSECLGEPIITNENCEESCKIIITQVLSVKIPIEYLVSTKIENSEVNCHNAHAQ